MGYRGKLVERDRARQLRAKAWTLQEIAAELSVSKSSVSLWVRDVEFTPRPTTSTAARRRPPNVLQRKKQDEIAELLRQGRDQIGQVSQRDLLIAGAALYAGEGSKADGQVQFANSDFRQITLFCRWLRTFFEVDEARLRMRLYLHEGLDLAAAVDFWSRVTDISPEQFGKPYRAHADASIRRTKHVYGCVSVRYGCSRTHRAIMGLVRALLAPEALGVVTPTGRVG